MSNQELFFLIFGLLCALAGYFVSRINTLITGILEMRKNKKIYPYYEEAWQERICKGPHKWNQATLALGKIVGKHDVCSECGFISGYGGDYKMNAPALEVYRSHLKRREERMARNIQIALKKNEFLSEALKRLLKQNYGTDPEVLKNFYWKVIIEADVANEAFKVEE